MIQDYFALFGLPAALTVDDAELKNAYQKLIQKLHPDKNPPKNAFEAKQNMMLTTTINEAYRVLQDPIERAAYLLQKEGIDAFDPHRTAYATSFLSEQLAWREALAAAKADRDRELWQRLNDEVTARRADNQQAMDALWQQKNFEKLAQRVGEARFLAKFHAEINAAAALFNTSN